MKLLANIPVRAIRGPCWTTFEYEVVEVQVLRVFRSQATRYPHLNRWHYEVDIANHPKLSPECIRTGSDGAYRVRVDRKLNRTWRPPEFQVGAYTFRVSA